MDSPVVHQVYLNNPFSAFLQDSGNGKSQKVVADVSEVKRGDGLKRDESHADRVSGC